jgi:hypothetical protein
MRNDRSAAGRHRCPALAFAAAVAFSVALPGASAGQEVAHGVTVLLPPSYRPPQESPAAASPVDVASPAEKTDAPGGDDAPTWLIVTPPPMPGWERPPTMERLGLVGVEDLVIVYSGGRPMPGWRKLRGVDIGYHRIGEPRDPSRIRTHFGPSAAPSRIRHHTGRSADRARIPTAGSGDALVSQSWNPFGARYQPSRIRYHGWSRASRHST